jgi:hypothetical protein
MRRLVDAYPDLQSATRTHQHKLVVVECLMKYLWQQIVSHSR